MLRKKAKPISFDAMVRFFMHNYEIPTKRDVAKLLERLDRLEKLASSAHVSTPAPKVARPGGANVASKTVLDVIRKSKNGLKFADIQAKTGYPGKKIRNIIFRLNKLKQISRHSRGVYISA